MTATAPCIPSGSALPLLAALAVGPCAACAACAAAAGGGGGTALFTPANVALQGDVVRALQPVVVVLLVGPCGVWIQDTWSACVFAQHRDFGLLYDTK